MFDILCREPVGSTYSGHCIIKDGVSKMSVFKVLDNNQSVLKVIFEAGAKAAMAKTSKCERVQSSASAINSVISTLLSSLSKQFGSPGHYLCLQSCSSHRIVRVYECLLPPL